ncbi:hypothetical protein H6F61_16475 [Cyanobacteria bacterium FACHB-472]|nr:hypothetical protein [Cyanobacteria bacterium FACHB-472]
MAELTIQIPDELAERLEPIRSRLPELLTQLLETTNPPASVQLDTVATPPDIPAVYTEVLDFLIKRPTPQEIAAFKVSSHAQSRLQTLLEKNRFSRLIEAELDVYEQLENLMILLKARAYAELS